MKSDDSEDEDYIPTQQEDAKYEKDILNERKNIIKDFRNLKSINRDPLQ